MSVLDEAGMQDNTKPAVTGNNTFILELHTDSLEIIADALMHLVEHGHSSKNKKLAEDAIQALRWQTDKIVMPELTYNPYEEIRPLINFVIPEQFEGMAAIPMYAFAQEDY